jgi:hypothetical protein
MSTNEKLDRASSEIYISNQNNSYAIGILTLMLLMSYVYDISNLRVNDLTLILLTLRK